MVGEEAFQSIRITLSDDAIVMLDGLKRTGKFRSRSSTIEEAIRTLWEVSNEFLGLRYKQGVRKKSGIALDDAELSRFALTVMSKLVRFEGLARNRLSRSE